MVIPSVKKVGYSSLRWNSGAQRYINERGKFASPTAIREIVDKDIAHRADRMQAHAAKLATTAAQFQAGAISESDWHAVVDAFEANMRREVKASQLVNGMAAAGGFHNATPATWGRVGQRIRYNYEKLANFAAELKADSQIATSTADGRMPFEKRVGLYSENGRFGYEAERREQHTQAGFKFEENVPASEKSCEGERGCVAQTKRGRVPIGTLIMIGKRSCGPADKCSFAYYRSAA